MKLTQLASSLPDSPEVFGEAEIAGLACDSRKVKAGDLYFCLPGLRHMLPANAYVLTLPTPMS